MFNKSNKVYFKYKIKYICLTMTTFAIRLKKYENIKDRFISNQHLRHKKTEEEYLDYLLKLDEDQMKREHVIYRYGD